MVGLNADGASLGRTMTDISLALWATNVAPRLNGLPAWLARIVEALLEQIRPGAKVKEVALYGRALCKQYGAESNQMAEKWPHFGHGVGLFFEKPYIGPEMCTDEDTFEEGMAFGIEAFYGRANLGSTGFEQNILVTKAGIELLTRTPMIWWD